VEGHQHDLVAFVKQILCSIALVNIPVKYEHLFALIHRVLSRNRNIIKEAKASRMVMMCMMAWRPDDCITARSRAINTELRTC